MKKDQLTKCGALKDSFRFNRYSTYRQEKDRESNCNLCPLFLTSTASVFTDAVFLAICLLLQTRYIFAHAQMRYNLPCGRLRYDINPFTPERVYRIEDISHAARVYRKSRKGFISLRSVLKGTTLKHCGFFYAKGTTILCPAGILMISRLLRSTQTSVAVGL